MVKKNSSDLHLKKAAPPRAAEWLLKKILPDADWNTPAGDFEEFFRHQVLRNGRHRAWFWYWLQVLRLVPGKIYFSLVWSLVMLKNYMKIALRNFKRQKIYSSINLTGLAVGIACCLLLWLWIQDERDYDRFIPHSETINLGILAYENPDGSVTNSTVTSAPLALELKEKYPEVRETTRYLNRFWRFGRGGKQLSAQGALVDPQFLEMFAVELVSGNSQSALNGLMSIVLSENFAVSLFGNLDPLDRTVTLDDRYDFKVTGVMKDYPKNSHLRFEYLIPFKLIEGRWNTDSWEENNYRTYIQLRRNINRDDFIIKTSGIIRDHIPESTATLRLHPLHHIHLYDLDGGGLITYIYIFSVMGFFILVIAGINYMNLSTARSAKRSREVGIRQVVGSSRSQLMRQFFGESILMSISAALLSLGLVVLFLPVFNRIAGKNLSLGFSPANLAGLLLFAFFLGLAAGIYPAVVLSSFPAVKVLKGALERKGNHSRFRKFLVVTQFTLSVFFMIGLFSVYRQVNFMRSKDLGYDRENFICMDIGGRLDQDYHAVKQELLKYPGVINMTRSNTTPEESESSAEGREVNWDGGTGKNILASLKVYGVDLDFLDTFQLKMVSGRFFSREFPSDPDSAFVLNQTAVRIMGLESPVGKSLSFWNLQGRIIGVIEDFHFRTLHYPIEPLVMRLDWGLDNLLIRIGPEDVSGTLHFIENKFKQMLPDYPFEFRFLDSLIEARYRAELRMGSVLTVVTVLAIFISGLGLLGMVSYITQQRTKEIGIRKIMGSSVFRLQILLSKEFAKWVLAANIIAWPIAYWSLNKWMQNFAYRVGIHPGVFLLSGLLTLIFAILTISIQIYQATAADPVESLRTE